MNWKEWADSKKKRYFAVAGFIVAYLLTIPIRDYSFLDDIVDVSQGVPLVAHLGVIVVGVVVILIGLWIIEMIVKGVVEGEKL